MKKSNLFKGILCGVMLAAVVSSTVAAGTVQKEVQGYRVRDLDDSYSGDVGTYRAIVRYNLATVTAKNISGSPKMYRMEAAIYDSYLKEYVDFNAKSVVSSPGGSEESVSIDRDYNEARYSYRLLAQGYNGTSTATGRADYYAYYVKQNS
ncbi:MAG: hypothetical protein ACI4EN_02635 [Butyrivibrio sp.]